MKLPRVDWKKTAIVAADVALVAYLAFAFTAFNKPDEHNQVCTKTIIDIADEATNGFISSKEIKARLEEKHIYPLGKPMRYVDGRKIEETLKASPFVNTAECYKTEDGHVSISITQRMPVIRVKANSGDDFYIDDNDCIMPHSTYTSDLIVATGHINRNFATQYISPLGKALMADDLWKNQVEQINVLPNQGIELVPRVGDHVVYLGPLPEGKSKAEREQQIAVFLAKKLERLRKFYLYGLSQAGWNKYSYINIEFDNQIICKKKQNNI